nr:hypothetical protein [Tanacetum cinerariifolium]
MSSFTIASEIGTNKVIKAPGHHPVTTTISAANIITAATLVADTAKAAAAAKHHRGVPTMAEAAATQPAPHRPRCANATSTTAAA